MEGGSSASDSEESSGKDLSSQLEDTSSKPHTLEDIFSSFFNTTCGDVAKMRRKEIINENIRAVTCTWSSQNSMPPVKDKEVLQKPDLVLLDDMEARWDTIKAVCKLTLQLYTPTGMIGKTIDSKAYLLLRHQPWRQFVLLFSLTHEYCELRVHMYNHAGGVVTPPIHINSAPNHFLYILSSVVFGNLDCIRYDPSISIFTKTLHPAQLQNPNFSPFCGQMTLMSSSAQCPEGIEPNTIINAPQAGSDLEMDSDMEMSSSLEESLSVISHTFALLIRSSGYQIRSDPIHRSIPDPSR
jgi:hypothetical protein